MTDKTKTVYTDEVVERMVSVYTEADTDEARAEVVAELANELGVKVASVRAKLVNLGVYKRKQRMTKDGATVETKERIVQDIERHIGVEAGDLDSLEKATKRVLKILRDAVA